MTDMLSPKTCVAQSIATPIMMCSYMKPISASSPVFAGPISAPKILVSFFEYNNEGWVDIYKESGVGSSGLLIPNIIAEYKLVYIRLFAL